MRHHRIRRANRVGRLLNRPIAPHPVELPVQHDHLAVQVVKCAEAKVPVLSRRPDGDVSRESPSTNAPAVDTWKSGVVHLEVIRQSRADDMFDGFACSGRRRSRSRLSVPETRQLKGTDISCLQAAWTLIVEIPFPDQMLNKRMSWLNGLRLTHGFVDGRSSVKRMCHRERLHPLIELIRGDIV